MKKIILYERRLHDYTANAKVNIDIVNILQANGFLVFRLRYLLLPFRGTKRILSICWWVYTRFILAKIKKGDYVILQYPSRCLSYEPRAFAFFKKLSMRAKLILLIQDLDIPRFSGEKMVLEGTEPVMKIANFAHKVIVHNAVMRHWFEKRGLPALRIVEQNAFDYLTDTNLTKASYSHEIIIAGNLSPNKAGYVAHLKDIYNVKWKLFTPYFDAETMGGPNVTYAGVCTANEFPALLHSGFGLVWDGDSINGCSGNAGSYSLLVNPHKLSLYLAAGLPVIVAKNAAIAKFVLERNVGFVVNSLSEIPTRLKMLTGEMYDNYAEHALLVAREIRSGKFLMKAIARAFA